MNKEFDLFVNAFKKQFNKMPQEYITAKIKAGSQIKDIAYLFDIIAAEVSTLNHCRPFYFDFFIKNFHDIKGFEK